MIVQVTFDPIEMLKSIDRNILISHVKNTLTDQEKEEMGDTIYNTDSDTLWEALELKVEEERKDLNIFIESRMNNHELLKVMDEEAVIKYMSDTYYIADNVPDLMEQIRVSGCIDEVTDMFTFKYEG